MYTIIIQSCWLDNQLAAIKAVFSAKTMSEVDDAAIEWMLINPPYIHHYYKVSVFSPESSTQPFSKRLFVLNKAEFSKLAAIARNIPEGDVVELPSYL